MFVNPQLMKYGDGTKPSLHRGLTGSQFLTSKALKREILLSEKQTNKQESPLGQWKALPTNRLPDVIFRLISTTTGNFMYNVQSKHE